MVSVASEIRSLHSLKILTSACPEVFTVEQKPQLPE